MRERLICFACLCMTLPAALRRRQGAGRQTRNDNVQCAIKVHSQCHYAGLFRSNLPAFIKENWLWLCHARKYISFMFFIVVVSLLMVRTVFSAELLKNGDFETGDVTGWKYWETYPWDGDGAPVELPTHITIAVPGTLGIPVPPTTSGSFSMAQQVSTHGTARGGLYQEVRVIMNTPYILTGHIAFTGDDSGDITVIGILDGAWNPALAFTTPNKSSISGNISASWQEISLMIIPTKDVITIFTETRQDWMHGYVAGWYDNLSLKPVPEPTKLTKSP